jgi:ribbon-helix-helix CopG family protein
MSRGCHVAGRCVSAVFMSVHLPIQFGANAVGVVGDREQPLHGSHGPSPSISALINSICRPGRSTRDRTQRSPSAGTPPGKSTLTRPSRHIGIPVCHHRWYHTIVEKTTIYLPSDLKAAVKHAAQQRGVSEAAVIRESIRAGVGGTKPRPRGGLYSSSEPIARRTDDLLDGFGER